jgi:hypothetical protein
MSLKTTILAFLEVAAIQLAASAPLLMICAYITIDGSVWDVID